MALEKIELPGMRILHGLFHDRLRTPCNHDCLFYEEIGKKLYDQFCEYIYRNSSEINVGV